MSAMTNGLKALHDQVLAKMPAGSHDPSSCPICSEEGDHQHQNMPGGSMPETFTQADLDAAVAVATDGLQQRLADLEAQVQETEVGRAVSAAVADKDTVIAELQSKLDAAEAAKTAAENKLVETEKYWADAIEQHEAAAAFAARREARSAKAREAGVFSEDYIAANADRFAAMSNEDFDDRMKEWALIAAQTPRGPVAAAAGPTPTALVASAATDSAKPKGSYLGVITEFRTKGVDPRALGGTA